MKAQARIPTEFHYWKQVTIPQESANGFQPVAVGPQQEPDLAHSCTRRLWNKLGEILAVMKSVAKFPLTSGRSGILPIIFLNVRAATEYQISFQPPKSEWSHMSRFSDHSRAPIHSPAGSQDAGEPGGGEQDGELSINVSPKMEQTEKSDNLEQLLCYCAWWGAAGWRLLKTKLLHHSNGWGTHCPVWSLFWQHNGIWRK